MRKLLILSGKGGTGKTTVAGTFIALSQARAYADCDVDAPNLHLLFSQATPPERTDFYGMPKAVIHTEKCVSCGKCIAHCRFSAIQVGTSGRKPYTVTPLSCEGCGVCAAVCPQRAITMQPARAGELQLYRGEESVFSTAKLRMGSGTSGKLVTEVKSRLNAAIPQLAPRTNEIAVLDGSPGIGCPVIASVSGTDCVLVVAEPSVSGISDMERVLKTVRNFGIKLAVCVNKADICPAKTQEIKAQCTANQIAFAGEIPYDECVITAINAGKSLAALDCPAAKAICAVYEKTMQILSGGDKP